jgi:alpha-tubulin suppressor-like RCC1 family protein
MKISRTIFTYFISGYFLLAIRCTDSPVTGNSSQTPNASIIGKLYNPDGVTPAANADVTIRYHSVLADISKMAGNSSQSSENHSAVTDNNGIFMFDASLDTGMYIIEAASEDIYRALIDSVCITNSDSIVRVEGTLKPVGAIRGVVHLTEGGDPRRVIVLAFGSNRFALPDSNGVFIFNNLAEAVYDLRIMPIIDNYSVFDTFGISVHQQQLTELGQIELPYTGLISPKGISAYYDTLRGSVILTWKPLNTLGISGYVVYRNDSTESTPIRLNKNLITDTFFIDTVFKNFSDTNGRVLMYRLKTQDGNANLSMMFSQPASIHAPSPEIVQSHISMKILNHNGNTFNVHDTLCLIASYFNQTRKNVKLEWFCDSRENSIRTIDNPAFSDGDTLYISWADTALKKIYLALTDEGKSVWWDSITVKIIDSAQIIHQISPDTVISIKDIIQFTGAASDNEGIIKDYAWDYDGNGIFDTIIAPGRTIQHSFSVCGTFNAVLRITYENGNRTLDTTIIIVLADEDQNNQSPRADILCVAAGDLHNFVLLSDSTIWAWGRNGEGVMGDGTPINQGHAEAQLTLKQIPVKGIQKIMSRSFHTFFLQYDGTLLGCGSNDYGQLGVGTTSDISIPVKIMDNVRDAFPAYNHSFILKTDNTLWACGKNYSGQLGDGSTVERHVPVIVMRDVKCAAGGSAYSLVLKNDLTLWSWGNNEFGQVGNGTNENRISPVQIMDSVQSIAAGYMHNLALKTDGTLWSWGNNRNGELGDGTTEQRNVPVQVMNKVESIAAGGAHTLILKTDGTLWGCGDNYYGQLGIGNTEDQFYPVQIMIDVRTMIAEGSKTLILRNNGTLWACGDNMWGNLGDGTDFNRFVPVKVLLP